MHGETVKLLILDFRTWVNTLFFLRNLLFCPFSLLRSNCGELLESRVVTLYFITLKSAVLKHLYLTGSSEMTLRASHVIN